MTDAKCAEDKFDWIVSRLGEGHTIRLSTSLRVVEITPGTWDKWQKKIGYPPVKTVNGSLYLARGKHWDCADYCHLTAGALEYGGSA